MRGDPHSYQSIAAQMPDDPFDYLDELCSERGCGYQAVDQDFYDDDLCADHLKEAVEWDRGE